VPNALEDDRFHDNPFVTGELGDIRFYAGAPLNDGKGHALGTICVLDTEPRHMTKEQIESLEMLSRQVMSIFELRIKIKEQARANRLLKKISDERDRFLSNMSHEIRTPLNAIVSSVNLMKDEYDQGSIEEYIDILKFSSENLMALVNDILDINKIESSKIKLEKAPVKIKELLRSIQSTYCNRAEEKGIGLHFFIDEKVPDEVIGDSVRIAQVLNNLISNAVKFTGEGEVKVELELKKIVENKAYLRFRVSDTGDGINAETQKSLFHRFSQGDESITRKYGGSGLGLYITQGLLKLMNSEINLVSEEGKGSVFSFDLKMKVAAQKSSAKLKTEIDFGKLTGNVLLVDDNQLNLVLA